MRPKTILFTMLNESGHLNPTFKLARALKARGHDVRYLAIADVQPLIEAQDFGVEPLFPDLFPRGSSDAEQKLGTVARRRMLTARYRGVLERLLSSPPFDLARVRPDLMLIDVTQTHVALWARRARQPFVYLNTSLPQTKELGVPPLRSGARYGARGLAAVRSELVWQEFLLKRRLSARLAEPFAMCPPYELARLVAPRFGVSARELDWRTVYMPQLRGVPELVFCPQAFDFPRAGRPERHYIESIDLERKEREFAWGGLSSDKPLIYCALGGQRYRAADVPGFFRRLVHAFRERPNFQLLLAAGKHLAPSEFDPQRHVVVVESTPQLAVLRRARVMITHGGLGSVKECIAHGVPMLGVPLDIDQPGNIARVVHHGIGLSADVRHSSGRELLAALDRLVEEPGFRQRVSAMQARFGACEAGQRGVEWIERQLDSGPLRED